MRRVIPFSVLTALSVCPSLGGAKVDGEHRRRAAASVPNVQLTEDEPTACSSRRSISAAACCAYFCKCARPPASSDKRNRINPSARLGQVEVDIAEAERLMTELEADVAETERLMIEVRVKLTASKSAGS
jgi:hypothetical protein